MFSYFLQNVIYHNTLKEWGMASLYLVVSFVLGRLVLTLNRRVLRKLAAKTSNKYDDILLELLETPLVFASLLVGIWMGIATLHFAEEIMVVVGKAYHLLIIFNIAWFFARLSNAFLTEFIDNSRYNGKLDKFLMKNVKKALVIVIWVIAALVELKQVGVDIGAIIAGLGIGGIAVALAAQDTIKNIFGGITIIVDRPFKIGERVKVSGFDGVVEHIGIRSTRLRTMENRLVTIPNYKIVDAAIENVSQEPTRKMVLTLGLTYQTTLEKMQEALQILKNLPAQVPDIEPNTTASFSGYGDFALEITFIYYVRKKAECDVFVVRSEVNTAILSAFNQAKLDFAYPTQLLYHTPLQESNTL